MPRNAEVIRQWSILRDLESSRRLTIDELAERTGVTTRTIRRDLEALQASGFPLYDDSHDGKRYWMLEQRPFRRLDDTGFTLAELSALYFSRTLVEALAATPFHHDLRSAFDKLPSALTPGHAPVPRSPAARAAGQGRTGRAGHRGDRRRRRRQVGANWPPAAPAPRSWSRRRSITAASRCATTRCRATARRPTSSSRTGWSSHRAVSTSWRSCRSTGSSARSRWIGSWDCRSRKNGSTRPMRRRRRSRDSLGVHQGTPPQRVDLAFAPRIARYVKERVWHASQKAEDQTGRKRHLVLHVSNDWALRSWILGFGPLARVIYPRSSPRRWSASWNGHASCSRPAGRREPWKRPQAAAGNSASEPCERATPRPAFTPKAASARTRDFGAAEAEALTLTRARVAESRVLRNSTSTPTSRGTRWSPARRRRRRCRAEVERAVIERRLAPLLPDDEQGRAGAVLPAEHVGRAERAVVEVRVATDSRTAR